MNELRKQIILGVGVTNEDLEYILEYIEKSLDTPRKPYYITTPNPEILVHASKHPEFKQILNQARISLCDGAGLWWASLIMGKPIKQRVAGTDFVKSVCEKFAEKPVNIGFLGAKGNVAELTAERLQQMYPGLRVVYAFPEWSEKGWKLPKDSIGLGRKNRGSLKRIDILFVAYGFPKQEEWMAKHHTLLPVTVMMGVGGAFDYISGQVSRAPFVLRFFGLEWLYRLIRQPWRLKRQLALLEFVKLVYKDKFA